VYHLYNLVLYLYPFFGAYASFSTKALFRDYLRILCLPFFATLSFCAYPLFRGCISLFGYILHSGYILIFRCIILSSYNLLDWYPYIYIISSILYISFILGMSSIFFFQYIVLFHLQSSNQIELKYQT